MATIAAAALVAGGAIYGGIASGKSAKKQQQMIEAQMIEARRVREENKGYANQGYGDINALLDNTPSLQSFLGEATGLAEDQQQNRLDFILGDSLSYLREAQTRGAQMAALDFSDFNLNEILKSQLYDIGSITRDVASGTFGQLAAQTVSALSQQGLSNTIGIGNYLQQVSGIDVYNPYNIAADLFSIEQGKVNSKIQARNNLTNQLTESNTQWFNNYKDLATASMAVEANKTNAQISAVNSAVGALAGGISSIPQTRALNAQTDYYNSLINKYGNN